MYSGPAHPRPKHGHYSGEAWPVPYVMTAADWTELLRGVGVADFHGAGGLTANAEVS